MLLGFRWEHYLHIFGSINKSSELTQKLQGCLLLNRSRPGFWSVSTLSCTDTGYASWRRPRLRPRRITRTNRVNWVWARASWICHGWNYMKMWMQKWFSPFKSQGDSRIDQVQKTALLEPRVKWYTVLSKQYNIWTTDKKENNSQYVHVPNACHTRLQIMLEDMQHDFNLLCQIVFKCTLRIRAVRRGWVSHNTQ